MKEAVKLRMVFTSSNNDRHPVPRTFTPLHYTCWHFTSSHLNFTHLHFTTLHYRLIWLNPISIPYRSISPHITTLHLTSLHCTFRRFSPQLYYLYFILGYLYFIFMYMHNNHCHRVTAHLQSNILYVHIFLSLQPIYNYFPNSFSKNLRFTRERH